MFDTRALQEAVDSFDRPRTFLLDNFFPDVVTFDTEQIDFDKLPGGIRLAPFVSPLVEGQPTKQKPFQTETFRPAYVKPKDVVKPQTTLRRRPGERLLGELTLSQRLEAATVDVLLGHRAAVLARKEWMAVQSVLAGAVTVVGDAYPSTLVSFGRHAALTIALTGAARWGQANVVPSDNLETWFDLVGTHGGVGVTDVVLDPLAWQLLRRDAQFRSALDITRQMSGKIEFGPGTTFDTVSDARYVGEASGVSYWVYQWTYETAAGTVTKMVPDNTVMGLARQPLAGKQLQGAILDVESLMAEEIFPKTWVEKDPSALFAMSQSAPLVAPLRPNACFCATINGPV